MKRREFLSASFFAGAASLSTIAATINKSNETKPEYYELRRYHMLNRSKQNVLNDFLQNAAIPAMNRIGIEPVGVFSVMYGPNSPTLYVLLPHKSLESFAVATSLLTADAKYQRAGASFLNAPLSDPAYVRMESSLMVAFEQMPKLKVPEKRARIFELRRYENHSVKASKKKIEMFNVGGEIEIFLKTGLQPVFFGETLIGARLPNLTYMLVFDNMAERDKRWSVFSSSPEWKKLRSAPEYADNVVNVNVIFLQPTPYSQI